MDAPAARTSAAAASTSVTWSVREGSSGGTVTSAGVYTPPSTPGTYHVVATSAADGTLTAVATVTVSAAQGVAVAVTPKTVGLVTGGTQTFTATVTGTTNGAVTWSLQESSGCGSITQAGAYVAPASAATCHVVATSAADTSKQDVATVTVSASGGRVARPSYNTGTGFFVANGKLYDANGTEFVPKGMNALHFDQGWSPVGNGTSGSSATFTGIPSSNANAVRLDLPLWGYASAAQLTAIMQGAVNNHIVPIPGVWALNTQGWNTPNDGVNATTCGGSANLINSSGSVKGAVDQWIAQYSVFKPFEKYMILNIANEWDGGWSDNSSGDYTWRDTYVTAVQRLRSAGYLATIMIDAGGACGQNPYSLQRDAAYILQQDPQHNVIFDFHVYAYWYGPTYGSTFSGQFNITTWAQTLAGLGVPIVVGEFGPGGGLPDSNGRITVADVINASDAHNIGWLAWAWDDGTGGGSFDGSGNYSGWYNMAVDAVHYASSSDLTGFGKLVVENASYGLKAKATKATMF